MLDDAILELIEQLIKQDIKDKKEGIEYLKISKKDLIRLNIDILKMMKKIYYE